MAADREQIQEATVPVSRGAVAKCPTARQYGRLLNLGGGAAGLSWTHREFEPYFKRGWVTGELKGRYFQFVRITPDGLRALALAVEKYGLPDLFGGPVLPHTYEWRCSKCASKRVYQKPVAVGPDYGDSNGTPEALAPTPSSGSVSRGC